jgi:hypothetical protein
MQQRRGLGIQVRIGISAESSGLRPRQRRLQQPGVADLRLAAQSPLRDAQQLRQRQVDH